MKYGNKYFMQVTRCLFDQEHESISLEAKGFFTYLNELEQRFCGDKKEDFFYHSNQEIADELKISLSKLKKLKAELVKTDLIETWLAPHVVNKETGRLSEKHVTHYRIIK